MGEVIKMSVRNHVRRVLESYMLEGAVVPMIPGCAITINTQSEVSVISNMEQDIESVVQSRNWQ